MKKSGARSQESDLLLFRAMDAEIIAVGSELLTPLYLDTNSLFLTDRLNSLGIEVRFKTVVGDRLADVCHGSKGRARPLSPGHPDGRPRPHRR